MEEVVPRGREARDVDTELPIPVHELTSQDACYFVRLSPS